MRISKPFRRMMIWFLAFALVAELGARILESRLPEAVVWDSPFAQAKAEEAADRGRVDLAVVGSSIGNANIDVSLILDEVGWAVDGYNAAVPAEAPGQWVVWAQDVIFPDLCPAVLLIAVGPRDMNDNKAGADKALAQYRNSQGRLALYGEESVAAKVAHGFAELSALVAIRERLREPANTIRYLRDGFAPGWPNLDLAPDGRYRGFDDHLGYEFDEERDEILRNGSLANYEVGPIELGALERLVELARSRGVVPVLVDMPYLRDELAVLVDDGLDDLDRYDQAIADLAGRLDVPLLRYPDVAEEYSFFADQYHMSQPGASEVSARIGADVDRLFPAAPQEPTCAPRNPEQIP